VIRKYLSTTNLDRSKNANLNIILSLFFKGGTIFLQFVLVSLTIEYIKPDAYGVWLTLSSLVGWISIFDVGIGNGLKNKLSESLAKKNYNASKTYVSTTYAIIGLICVGLILLYFLVTPFVNWQFVFNSKLIPEKELHSVVTVVSICFFLKFVSDIINVVAASFQMVSISSMILFFSNLFLVISIWILTRTTSANLFLLAFILSFIPLIFSVGANVYLFSKKFKKVTPSFKAINFNKSKGIISTGTQFFILQITSLIIFQTDNILISQLFDNSAVTDFNITYKYFSIVTILFTILLTPYWTAFTEAFQNNEYKWIQITIRTLIKYWFLSIFLLVIMMLSADIVINYWVGNSVSVSFPLSLSICLYIITFNWNAIFASFLNGVGKIRVQIIYAILMGIVNIPLSFFLVEFLGWGIYAMPASNFFCLLLGAMISYIQYRKIITKKAIGIWNK